MKEDIIAANLSSIRQSIEELKKNNSSQFPQNVPNWDELVNKIAQEAANEVRILLENRQKKFKEEAVKNVKGEMTYDEYIDSLSERYDDVLHKIDVLYDLWVKICKVYHQMNEERKSLKVTIEKFENELECINDKIPNNHPQVLEFPIIPSTPKGLITYILADIPSYWTKRIWHSKHVKNLILIILICLWAISIGVTGFIIRDNMALHERMQLIELQWRK